MSVEFTHTLKDGRTVEVTASGFQADPDTNCYSIDDLSAVYEGTDTLAELSGEDEQRLYEAAWERYDDVCAREAEEYYERRNES